MSGCRESNPDRIHPMDVYYHYTTARLRSRYVRASAGEARQLFVTMVLSKLTAFLIISQTMLN